LGKGYFKSTTIVVVVPVVAIDIQSVAKVPVVVQGGQPISQFINCHLIFNLRISLPIIENEFYGLK
jgi:hypothetical protein